MTNKKIKEYSKNLSNLIILPKIIKKILGFENNIFEFFEKNKLESYEFTDKSNFITEIINIYNKNKDLEFKNKITEDDLLNYDLNIKNHLDKIKRYNFNLKYYQYLALLYTEIYLDLYFKHKTNKINLIEFLNNSIDQIYNDENNNNKIVYTEKDISKICFWMATGSGKTIIMHINFLQYIYYSNKYNQNINQCILITPNEDLSEQHMKELKSSHIEFQQLNNKISVYKDNKILKIIDINKISGGNSNKNTGISISYKSFGTNNLILVDEGHRGISGKAWLNYRNQISNNGFTFEYSATFQDVQNEYVTDYKKTILFDYSFKYFNNAGYGKNYDICGVNSNKNENTDILLFLGNLLSFFEQKKLYIDNKLKMDKFNIKNPLWIAVGSKVTTKNNDLTKGIKSDIIKIINFLAKFKKDKKEIIEYIKNIFEDNTNLEDENKNSFFKNKYMVLKEIYKQNNSYNFNKIYNDILKYVFYDQDSNNILKLVDIKYTDGEIGLKFSNKYFGLIYVGKGNDKDLLKLKKENKITELKEKKYIEILNDTINKSLFETLNYENKKDPLNFLIGARKFISGWNNYRISSILLVNFAKKEGVSAIQLFGRGIRLYGIDYSLKRTSDMDIDSINSIIGYDTSINKKFVEYLKILETLFIYGLNAKYMNDFRDELDKDIEYFEEKTVNIEINDELINKNLIYLKKTPADKIDLTPIKFYDDFNIDLNQKVFLLSNQKEKNNEQNENKVGIYDLLDHKSINILDWAYIIYEIRKYKNSRNYNNIIIPSIEKIKENLLTSNFKFIIPKNFDIKTNSIYTLKNNIYIIQLGVIEYLKKCITKTYSQNKRKNEEYNIYKIKSEDIINKINIRFIVDKNRKLKSENENVIELYNLLKSNNFNKEINDKLLPDLIIKFDKHLFFPLFIMANNINNISFNPSGLIESEIDFVNDLKIYLKKYSFEENYDFVLLRNFDRNGVGFLLENGNYFYPDFILWIIDNKNKEQKILFIDPKGLIHMTYENKLKVNIEDYIKTIENRLKENNKKYDNYTFDFYARIVTATSRKDVNIDNSKGYIIFKDDIVQSSGFLKSQTHKYLYELFKSINIV